MSNSKVNAAASSTATQSYYAVLGLCKRASPMEIRSAYRKLALVCRCTHVPKIQLTRWKKWHPDRCTRNDPLLAGDANKRFQQIQEAYSVLSDNGKRLLYDAEMLDVIVDDDNNEGFSDFMQEMMKMMESSRAQKTHSLEELQVMLEEMMAEDDSFKFNFCSTPEVSCKRTRFGTP